jgi:site-specific DNA recombinase
MMDDMLTSEFDGCGRCLVGVRRLSRKTDKTSSPQRQADQILGATAGVDGHIIAWADDWEVSGATDPLTRRGFGPWLRGELGPYDGVVAASVDRVGRNVRDTLNTQTLLTGQDRVIVTADHVGVWDFSDPNQENEWLMKAWGSQMELRMIQKRNRDETVRARDAGEPRQRPSYGYMFVRLVPTGKVDHVALDTVAAEVIREAARRILADETGTVTVSAEAARLTRARIPSPLDRMAELYGRPVQGRPWSANALLHIFRSEAALGYLMHGGRPVLGEDGRPVRIAEPLWDRATHDALLVKTATRKPGNRAPKGTRLLSGIAFCGNCGRRMYVTGRYECDARIRGVPGTEHCKPAPVISLAVLDSEVSEWFVSRYGTGEVMRKVYDPGTGHAAQVAELKATRSRLRDDRKAGLYNDPEEKEWYQVEYRKLSDEIAELAALPERKPGMRMVPTGRTITQEWEAADIPQRREMLAEFEVRVVVHPTGHEPRVGITGMALPEDLGMTA